MALGMLTAAIAPVAIVYLWFHVIADADSTSLLKSLTKRAGLGQSRKSDIEFVDMDGTMPEISRQRLNISGNAGTAMSALRTACHDIGLGAPDADQSATEPDMICSGTFEGARVSVHASPLCEAACDIAIETRAF